MKKCAGVLAAFLIFSAVFDALSAQRIAASAHSGTIQPRTHGVMYEIDFNFMIDFADSENKLNFKIALELSSQNGVAEAVKKQGEMINLINKIIKTFSEEDLKNKQKIAEIKIILVRRLNELFSKDFVKDIFFTEFIFI